MRVQDTIAGMERAGGGRDPEDGELAASHIRVPLGLAGLRIVAQTPRGDATLEVTVMGTNGQARCPHCGGVSRQVHDVRRRRKRDVGLGANAVVLVLCKRRFSCRPCGRAFTEPDIVCGWRRRTTARLREQIGEQACTRPLAGVAAEHDVGPRFVQTCWEQTVAARLHERGRSVAATGPLPTPRFLGIDEFARRKGRRYDTILCDLEQRRVLEVSVGRTQAEVVPLLERLDDPEHVEAVSMDMSTTFREAVRLCLPQAAVVADHFHVVQHVGKALAKVFTRCAATREGRAPLKGQRALFLRPRERLTAEQEHTRATRAAAFPDLAAAWQAKEDLRTWYAQATAQTAAGGLDTWVATVVEQGPAELRQALSAFRTWRDEILAFFRFLPTRLTNGFVEGKNNRTKALMRAAYGYRNHQHLRWRILLEVA